MPQDAALEWGIEPLPPDKRRLGFTDIFALWFSLGVGLLVMQAGALLVQWLGLSLAEAVIISLSGSLIGSLLLAGAGVVGSMYGVPTMVSLRPVLGVKGAYLPALLNLVQLVGWATFELVIMSNAAALLTGNLMGRYAHYIWIVLFSFLCYLMAVSGPLAVVKHWLEKFAVWLMMASSLWITLNLAAAPPKVAGWRGDVASYLLGLDLVVAMPVSWMPLVSDYNRFARSSKSCFIATLISYSIANTWFYSMGAALAALYPGESVVYSIALLMLGGVAIIGILVDEIDNAFADVYSAAVSLKSILPRADYRVLVTAIAAASAIMAFATPITEYENFLLLIGASFIPLFGVMFSDYLVVRRGSYKAEEFYPGKRGFRPESFAAWLVGFATYVALTYVYRDLSIGASLPSLASSFITHLAASSLARLKDVRRSSRASGAGEYIKSIAAALCVGLGG